MTKISSKLILLNKHWGKINKTKTNKNNNNNNKKNLNSDTVVFIPIFHQPDIAIVIVK